MKKNIKFLFFIAPIAAVICLLCVFSSDETTKRIDSIENYETVFQSVEELKFFIGDNNFYSTQSPDRELRTIKKVKINLEPTSEDRSKDRGFEYKIIINGKFIIYINSYFTQLWLDDTKAININYDGGSWNKELEEGISPSLSYSIENPEILKELFQQYSQHIN